MRRANTKYIVLFYWDKSTWYAFGSLTASISRFEIPYEIIKGGSLATVNKWLSQGYRVIYAESSRNMSLQALITRLKTVKTKFSSSDVINVVGGPQASGDPSYLLTNGADYVVVGEGEVTFPKLIQDIVENDFSLHKPENISGIAVLDENSDIYNAIDRKVYNVFTDSKKLKSLILDEGKTLRFPFVSGLGWKVYNACLTRWQERIVLVGCRGNINQALDVFSDDVVNLEIEAAPQAETAKKLLKAVASY